jgi:phosphoglycerol transferase MdoB-like AlkP superfamily enzyme
MFDKLYFEEDFPKPLKRGHWGLGDYSFLKKISTRKVVDKSFYFIITSGMHPPYRVPEDEKNALFGDENVDAYLNAASYFDNGLKELYFKAPDDSLFIIYGDHNVPELDAFDTPVLLTYKGDKILTINGEKETGFNGTVYFINSLFDGRN